MRPVPLQIAASHVETLHITGDYVRNRPSQPAVLVTDEATGASYYLEAGDGAVFKKPFSRLQISHGEGSDQTLTLDIGDGRVLSSQVSGQLQPVGGAANAASPPLVSAADVVAALASITAKRTALTDLTGCSYAIASAATVVLATAAANTAGVRIAVCDLSISTTATVGRADLKVGTAALLNLIGTDVTVSKKDIYVPAGVEVSLYTNISAATARAAYEVY